MQKSIQQSSPDDILMNVPLVMENMTLENKGDLWSLFLKNELNDLGLLRRQGGSCTSPSSSRPRTTYS